MCLNCAAPLGPKARFCPKCGQASGSADGPGYTVMTPSGQAPPPGWGEQTRADWGEPTVTRTAVPYRAALPPPPPQDPPYFPPSAYEGPETGYDGTPTSYDGIPAAYDGGPAAYDGGPAGQEHWGQQDFESFRPYPPSGPPGGPPPSGPSSRRPGARRQPPRRHDRDRSRTPLTLWIVLLVIVVGGGAAVLLVAHPFSHPSARQAAGTAGKPAASGGAGGAHAAGSAGKSPAASSAGSASASAGTEQQAAAKVDTMLKQSVSDRSAITQAYTNVLTCSPQRTSAAAVFTGAAASRQKLLAGLGTMAGRATLPPALLTDLTQSWQASVAADQAFAQWANAELANCTPNDTGSAAYQATVTPDSNATKFKTLFVAQWNPVAAKFNLTQYQPGDL